MFEIENCYSVPLLAKERGPDLPPEPPSPRRSGPTYSQSWPFGERIANWLRAPESAFDLIMRAYSPRPEIAVGEWLPPPLKQVR